MKTLALILFPLICTVIIAIALYHVHKDAYKQGWLDGYREYLVDNHVPDGTIERVIRRNQALKEKSL